MPTPLGVTKNPDYYKNYYKEKKNQSTTFDYNQVRYAKCRYKLSDEECELYKDNITDYGKMKQIIEKMKSKYPDCLDNFQK